MSESISIVALLIAISAMGVSYLTFWFDWRKQFKLSCTLLGWIWHSPVEGRADTPLSLILTLVVRNEGARPGMLQAAYVNLFSVVHRCCRHHHLLKIFSLRASTSTSASASRCRSRSASKSNS